MKEEAEVLFKEFCENMDSQSHFDYKMALKPIEVDLQFLGDKGKIKYIKNAKKTIVSNLMGSYQPIKIALSRERVESDLVGGLHIIFRNHGFHQVKEVKYDEKLNKGSYTFEDNSDVWIMKDWIADTLIVNSKPFEHTSYPMVDFSLLDVFQPVVQYLGWMKLFLKLNSLEKDIKEGKEIDEGEGLPKNNSAEGEYSVEIKTEVIDETSLSMQETILPSKFLQFFKEGAYELFCYLETEYSLDDKKKKVKYSNLFHFLNYHSLVISTQDQYKEFIEGSRGVKMSKVLPQTNKYNEKIFPLLGRQKANFDKRNKKEMK